MSRDPVRWLEEMLLIRAFEDRVSDLYAQGAFKGTTHLCAGQEAVAVGVARAASAGDLMTCTYRGHGHCLAWGMSPEAALAEILGRATGCCRGRGGTMHLTDLQRGNIKHDVDFRSVYSYVIENWMSADPVAVFGSPAYNGIIAPDYPKIPFLQQLASARSASWNAYQ